jgi:ABC-type antimicrobial peptide transport system permease subunit
LFEIPSFVAGLIAFLFVFLLTGIMFFVLREERDKTIPPLNIVGPTDVARLEPVLTSSDAPFLAIVTLITLEITLDALIVVSVLQGMGSTAVGTMLAVATFLAAAILEIYRSSFMGEAFLRKRRLEIIATNLFEENDMDDALE